MRLRPIPLALCSGVLLAAAAAAQTSPQELLQRYAEEAGGAEFSAERGRAFFMAEHAGGKPETPSCTTCHTDDVTQPGRTRAGKRIEPLAVSANPERLTDPTEVAKWFHRNCNSVLGRACTPQEKGDVVAFLAGI